MASSSDPLTSSTEEEGASRRRRSSSKQSTPFPPPGFKFLEDDDIKMLPLSQVAIIHQDTSTKILLQRQQQQQEVAATGKPTSPANRKSNNIIAATRGIIPVKQGIIIQEDASSLGNVLQSSQAVPQIKRRGARKTMPWSSTKKNLDVSNVHFSDEGIDDLTASGGSNVIKNAAGTSVPTTTSATVSAIDLNSQAQLTAKEGEEGGGKGGAAAHLAMTDAAASLKTIKAEESSFVADDAKNSATYRGYMQLLDHYSLHHFIIYQGQVISETPEFESFHRLYSDRWGSVSNTISSLERVLRKHSIPVAVIDGPRLADLAVLEALSTEKLLSCIANVNQIQPLMALQKTSTTKTQKKKVWAAIKIQAVVRGFLARRRVTRIRLEEKSAIVMQSTLRTFLSIQRAKRALRKTRQGDVERWKALAATLKTDWPSILSGAEHVIIHIPSISVEEHLRLGLSHFAPRQNLQLARIYDALCLPHTTVIYLSPYHLPDEVVESCRQHFSGGLRRLHVIVPENADRFPAHFSLATLVLNSPRCLRRIRSLIKERPAYLLPGISNWQDKKLAESLKIPLMASDPTITSEFSTRSGLKRAFMEAGMNLPVGGHDIYDEEQLLLALTKLIAGNLAIDRWLIKVDMDYESLSWAYLDVATNLECLAGLRKEKVKLEEMNPQDAQIWLHPDVQLLARSKIICELRMQLQHKAVICNEEVYPSWTTFMAYLGRYGAVVEAEPKNIQGYPSCSLFIDPINGGVTIKATYDLLLENQRYHRLASLYPCTSVPLLALKGACQRIGKLLYERGVIGYLNLDFVAFYDADKNQLVMWAVDGTMGLSTRGAHHNVFQLLTRGPAAADEEEDKPIEQSRGESKNKAIFSHYALIEWLPHASFYHLPPAAFFKACRVEGLSLLTDLADKDANGSDSGIYFEIVDDLQAVGALSIVTIGTSTDEILSRLLQGLDFLKRQLGTRGSASKRSDHPLASTSSFSIPSIMKMLEQYRKRIGGDQQPQQQKR